MEPETVFTDDDPEFEALVADAKSGKIDNGLKATLYEVRSMQSCYRILHEGRTFELGIRMEWWGKDRDITAPHEITLRDYLFERQCAEREALDMTAWVSTRRRCEET